MIIISCTRDSQPGRDREVSNKEMKYYSGSGVGPVSKVDTGAIDTVLASSGKRLFDINCISCHQVSKNKVIGPGLLGVTLRRTPEWIMNQILNPIGMTQSDSLAKELLSIYLVQMVPMGISEEQARSILEYFRMVDHAQLQANRE